jgi:hypothetical protein
MDHQRAPFDQSAMVRADVAGLRHFKPRKCCLLMVSRTPEIADIARGWSLEVARRNAKTI